MNEGYTIQEVADIADREGLGYAITDYLAASTIADPDLAAAWQAAYDAMEEICHIFDSAEDADPFGEWGYDASE